MAFVAQRADIFTVAHGSKRAESLSARNALAVRVGRRLFACRRERGLTQQQLARKLKIRSDTLSRIERGQHTASLQTLERISLALDIPLVVFFEDTSLPGSDLTSIKEYLRELTTEERQLVLRVLRLQSEFLRSLRRARELR